MLALCSYNCIISLFLATIFQNVNAFTSTTANTRSFLQPPTVGTRLGLFSQPMVDLQNHLHTNGLKNTVPTSNSILISSTVANFKNVYPIGHSIHPTVNDYATKVLPSDNNKEQSTATTPGRGFKVIGVSQDPYNLASAPEYLKSPQTQQPAVINPKIFEFYALEMDFLSKLPLAAAIYVGFEFFFMSQKRQIDLEDSDGTLYYENEEEEEAREVTQFWTVVGLRTFAAFSITFLSLFISKMDLTQIDSIIR